MYCTDRRHEAIWNARHLQPLSAFNATSSASKESAEFFNRFDRALSAMPDLVTLVITSCNRPQLLQNTLRSFVKYAVCTVDQICQFDLCADTIRILLAVESSSRTAATAQASAMHESTPLTHVCHVIMQASTTDGSMSWSCLSSIFPYELYIHRIQRRATRKHRHCVQSRYHSVDISLRRGLGILPVWFHRGVTTHSSPRAVLCYGCPAGPRRLEWSSHYAAQRVCRAPLHALVQ